MQVVQEPWTLGTGLSRGAEGGLKREERRTGEEGGRVTGIQQATKKGSKNLLTHTHNTLTYTDSNTALCNEEKLANPLCVIVKI